MGESKLKTVEGVGRVANLAGTIEFRDDGLKWTPAGRKKDSEGMLELSDIIAVSEADNDDSCLVVHHICRKKTELSVSKTALDCEDRTNREDTVTKVRTALTQLPGRPRKLLVVINPQSGARKAVEVYGRKVAPLFTLVGIETDVMVTEQPGHATEYLKSYDLSSTDGVVAVGGDGTFSECATGILEYTKQMTNWAVSNPPEPLPSTQVPLGMIGAGTGNAIPLGLFNTKDVTSAALYIILGHQGPWNLATVNQGETFVGYSSLFVANGLMSDAGYYIENNRQGGSRRLLYGFLKSLVNIRSFPAEISVRLKSEEEDAPNAEIIQEAPSSSMVPNEGAVNRIDVADQTGVVDPLDVATNVNDREDADWKVFRGHFVNYVMMLSPTFSNSVVLTQKCTFNRLNMIKSFAFMYSLDQRRSTEHIKIIPNVQELRVQLLTDDGYEVKPLDRLITIDGEYAPLPDEENSPSHSVKVHRGLLKVFCR